jgi:3-oxoacyl-[acyl-carrier protein] reductase
MMNIIITGTSRGIGYDTALELCADSNNKILAISRSAIKQELLIKNAIKKNKNHQLQTLRADITDSDLSAISDSISDWEKVDLLINNAGQLASGPFETLTDVVWKNMFDVNLFGPVKLINLLLPKLEAARGAHIVNLGSMGGFQGSSKFPGLSAYSASKAALANLTECLAEEFKDKKISVNCLCLGAVNTEMLAAAFPGYKAPLDSHQMANFLAWFGLNGHTFFNGKILPVSVSTP